MMDVTHKPGRNTSLVEGDYREQHTREILLRRLGKFMFVAIIERFRKRGRPREICKPCPCARVLPSTSRPHDTNLMPSENQCVVISHTDGCHGRLLNGLVKTLQLDSPPGQRRKPGKSSELAGFASTEKQVRGNVSCDPTKLTPSAVFGEKLCVRFQLQGIPVFVVIRRFPADTALELHFRPRVNLRPLGSDV